ncbi:MAG: uracil-DNA glycosylase [Spirochaetales bacterium]|nr:uracil-DNA glycosylase [Spirochaetales bacterium]
MEQQNSTSSEQATPSLRELYASLCTIEHQLRFGCRAESVEVPAWLPEVTLRAALGTASGQGTSASGQNKVEAASSPLKEVVGSSRNVEEALAAMAAEVEACRSCALSQTRTRSVFGQGVAVPLVLVIGEGPGAEEDRQGLPFVGASGKLLDKMLAAINLSRQTNCYIANIVKCRPPNNREPSPIERDACIGYLERQIELLKPRFILCAGRTAAHGLLGTTEPISRLRGRTFVFHDIPVVVTFHPSALLRDESLKRPAWEDLKRLRDMMAASSTGASHNRNGT